MKEQIVKLKTVAIGQIAPDFTQNDTEGNPVKFSDIYAQNEVTLLDFWAAWCGPCRGENPNVVAAYNKYKEKNFTVLGVSLDKTKGPWVDAIKKDGLVWQQVSDLKGWSNAVAQLFGIQSIPQNFLLDPSGVVIDKLDALNIPWVSTHTSGTLKVVQQKGELSVSAISKPFFYWQ